MRNPINTAVMVAALCTLVVTLAVAEPRTVSWQLPTTNTNGSALPASQITRTTIYWGASQTAMTNSRAVTGAATSTTIDLAPGTYFIGAKVTANGNESAMSNVQTVTIAQPTPNPPTGLTVQAVVAGLNMSPAYKILKSGERSQVVSGFVTVGTPCEGPVVFRYRDRDYREVSARKVKWWNPPLADVRTPPRVAVACG